MRLNDARSQKGSETPCRVVGELLPVKGASSGYAWTKLSSGGGTRPGFEGGQQSLYRRLPK